MLQTLQGTFKKNKEKLLPGSPVSSVSSVSDCEGEDKKTSLPDMFY